jgi:hypothetical protein
MLAVTLVLPLAAAATETPSAGPYAGEEGRAIKSLSAEDIAELRRGGGWGLAKAAELNGMPGPPHLLELQGAIPLEAAQVAELEALFEAMQADAIAVGEELIRLEAALDTRFRDTTITEASLGELLAQIAETRSRLRYIHLATHLATPALLSEQQISRYNALRGYAGAGDACAGEAPAGHDPAMWRRHQGCD